MEKLQLLTSTVELVIGIEITVIANYLSGLISVVRKLISIIVREKPPQDMIILAVQFPLHSNFECTWLALTIFVSVLLLLPLVNGHKNPES